MHVRLKGSARLELDIRTSGAPSLATVDEIIAHPGVGAPLLIADRLSQAARTRLREAGWGWLDRRGHLRVWSPPHGIMIETQVESSATSPGGGYEDPLATGVGLEVAVALLLEPAIRWGVRALAGAIDRSPGSVSTALKRFREAALVTEDLRPLVPELFDEVCGYWRPHRVALAAAPLPGDARALERLRFDVDHPDAPGWALTDTLAADHLGAPVVVGTGYPPDFYVPSERVLRDAVNHLGLAPTYEARACTVSVPPVPAAVTHRIDVAGTEVLLTRSLFVALELARDRARGREILDRWDPPAGHARVW